MDLPLSIIIVNYNTPELVYNCLKSIKKNLHTKYEVIVVDNSSDEKLRVNDQELKKINLVTCNLKLVTNNGFGAANNLGAKKAKGEYLWFLNCQLRTKVPICRDGCNHTIKKIVL